MLRHIMLDLETLGVSPYSTIIAIGACVFDPYAAEQGDVITDRFEVAIKPVNVGLRVDADTLMWWMDAERDVARAIWMGMPKVELRAALDGFADWLRSISASGQWTDNRAWFFECRECEYDSVEAKMLVSKPGGICPLCAGDSGHEVELKFRSATEIELAKLPVAELVYKTVGGTPSRTVIAFNPSANTLVDQIKQKTAELIDICATKPLQDSMMIRSRRLRDEMTTAATKIKRAIRNEAQAALDDGAIDDASGQDAPRCWPLAGAARAGPHGAMKWVCSTRVRSRPEDNHPI